MALLKSLILTKQGVMVGLALHNQTKDITDCEKHRGIFFDENKVTYTDLKAVATTGAEQG